VLEGAQPDERPASLTLRSQLLALVLVALVPILVLSVVLISWGVRLHRDAVDRGLTDTARALATAVDERIAVWQGALAALATSPAFDNGDFSGFYRQAADVAHQHGGWIIVFDETFQQRINTLKALGEPLPKSAGSEPLRRIFATGESQAIGLYFGKTSQRWLVAVDMPIKRGDRVAFVLTMSFEPKVLSAILARQEFTPGWVARLTDENDKFIARSQDADAYLGKSLPDEYARAIAGQDAGMLVGPAVVAPAAPKFVTPSGG